MKMLAVSALIALSCAGPAEAGIFRGFKKVAAVTAGAVMFPVVAPISYVGQKCIVAACYAKADWRMASYVMQDRVYDWCWLENWW